VLGGPITIGVGNRPGLAASSFPTVVRADATPRPGYFMSKSFGIQWTSSRLLGVRVTGWPQTGQPTRPAEYGINADFTYLRAEPGHLRCALSPIKVRVTLTASPPLHRLPRLTIPHTRSCAGGSRHPHAPRKGPSVISSLAALCARRCSLIASRMARNWPYVIAIRSIVIGSCFCRFVPQCLPQCAPARATSVTSCVLRSRQIPIHLDCFATYFAISFRVVVQWRALSMRVPALPLCVL
jgi:hypothetical protein